MSNIPISVCIIAKNEERFLAGCLERLTPLGLEIVVVDTGSNDKTVEIAKKYTDKVYFFEWINDFSAAKNFASSKATNDWILSLDCDEYLGKCDTENLLSIIDKFSYETGMIAIENLIRDGEGIGKSNQEVYRLYNKKYNHFEGIIHEQIRGLNGANRPHFDANISITHYGYFLSPEEIKIKNERNITLLMKQIELDPNEPYYYFQLGQSYAAINDYENVFQYLNKGLSLDPDPNQGYTHQMLIDYGSSMLNTERYELALNMEKLYEILKDYSDYFFLLGRIYYANHQLFKAIETFVKATTAPKCIVFGTNSFFPLHSMALIYEQIGEKDLADTCNKQVEELVSHVEMK